MQLERVQLILKIVCWITTSQGNAQFAGSSQLGRGELKAGNLKKLLCISGAMMGKHSLRRKAKVTEFDVEFADDKYA